MTEEAPVTLDSLVADLRKLGLEEGDAVVMRCATRAIAPSAKGMAAVLLDALLQTVGPTGTVVGPTHAALQKASEKRPVAVFSDDAPTTAGGFGAAMLRHPDRVRSGHPHNSVAAIGAQAHFLLDAHDEHALPFSWMPRMIEIGGKELVIGCVTDNPGINTVHLTQEQLGLSGGSFLPGKGGHLRGGSGRGAALGATYLHPGLQPGLLQDVRLLCSRGYPARRLDRRGLFDHAQCRRVRAGRPRDHDEESARRALRQPLVRLMRKLVVLAAQAAGPCGFDGPAQGEGRP